ncbi:hypothetical protein CVT25_014261 [Psilocybe cyanescens]|uniref:Helicase ATP-binding domain-containing protein n=1 Tax=Psilocybe cyanescens TaxID=93625 RepID=A0A409VPD7_PSICY|nr:hypothetical protein CVT25_014261 [Psilocybe cyanescens]
MLYWRMLYWRIYPFLIRNYARRCYGSANLSPITPLELYQDSCLDHCISAVAAGETRIGVSFPSGVERLTAFASLLSRIPPPPGNPQARKALILVDNLDQAEKYADRIASLYPDWNVMIEKGGKIITAAGADVTIAPYQSLKNKLDAFDLQPQKLKAIIIDEAHRVATSLSYHKLLKRFRRDIYSRAKVKPGAYRVPIIGFSANFTEDDPIFDTILSETLWDIRLRKWLRKVQYTSVDADLNLGNIAVTTTNGDFDSGDLEKVVNTDAVNELVVLSWRSRASQAKSTIVFCINSPHVQALKESFQVAGIDARTVTDARTDLKTVLAFREGQFPVLLFSSETLVHDGASLPILMRIFLATASILVTAGSPKADCVVIVHPTRSSKLYAHMVSSTHKLFRQVIDIVDSHTTPDQRLVLSPSLYGINSSANQAERQTDPSIPVYIDSGDIFLQKIPPSIEASEIVSLSPLDWIDCGNSLYILNLYDIDRKGEDIRITRKGDRYFIAHTATNKRNGSMEYRYRNGLLGSLAAAVESAEHYIESTLLDGLDEESEKAEMLAG